jgi:hypothetical protein
MKDANGPYLDISPAPATRLDAYERCVGQTPPSLPGPSLWQCRLLTVSMSAFGGKADIRSTSLDVRY